MDAGKKTKHSVRIIVRSTYDHILWYIQYNMDSTYSTVCVREPTQRNNSNAPRAGPALSCYEKIYHRLFLPGDETNHHSKSKISTTTTTTLCYWNGNKDEISALSERYESVMEKRRRRQTIPGNGNDNDENDNDNDASICQSSSVSITDIFC